MAYYGPVGIAKACLEESVAVLADELAAVGTRVNALRPWVVDTQSARSAPSWPATETLTLALTPLGRMLSAADVAAAAAWLVSDSSVGVTGQVITVDGGLLNAL
jgi:enoyl-[acyl-carrier-protein] reductase (NADH)